MNTPIHHTYPPTAPNFHHIKTIITAHSNHTHTTLLSISLLTYTTLKQFMEPHQYKLISYVLWLQIQHFDGFNPAFYHIPVFEVNPDFISISICVSIRLYVCVPAVYLPVCLSFSTCVSICVCLSVCVSLCLSFSLNLNLGLHNFFQCLCWSFYMSICIVVFPFISFLIYLLGSMYI